MRRSGSSLLLVSMIIAGIITVVFTTQRIALIQFSQSTAEEDNIFAMQAAKAGIEDGLMRFRFNRNTEIENYQRVYFMQAKATGEGVEAGGRDQDTRPDQQYYELNITYRTNQISRTLVRNESIELSGFAANTKLNYSLKFNNCLPGWKRLQLSTLTTSGTVVAPKIELGDISASRNFNSGESLRLLLISEDENCTVDFSAEGSNNFDGLTTYITSTGYFGSAKRTFVAEVDRLTGSLVNIFEFTAMSGEAIRRR